MKRGKRKQLNKLRMQLNKIKDKSLLKDYTEDENIKFSTDKSLVIRAWKRYKANHKEESSGEENDDPLEENENKVANLPSNQKFRKYVGKKFVKAIVKSMSRTK